MAVVLLVVFRSGACLCIEFAATTRTENNATATVDLERLRIVHPKINLENILQPNETFTESANPENPVIGQ